MSNEQPRVRIGRPGAGRFGAVERPEADINLTDLTASFIVYGLRLADSDEYRYIGKTSRGAKQRLSEHRHHARTAPSTPVQHWMKRHVDDELAMDVLAVAPEGDHGQLNALEVEHIAALRAVGHPLLNLTDGGEGTPGYVPTEAKRELMSKLMSGEGNPMFGSSRTGEQNPMFGRSGPLAPSYGKFGEDAHAYGFRHTEEHKAELSVANSGPGNPMFGRSGPLAPGYGRVGALNPAFGKPGSMLGRTGESHPAYGRTNSPETIRKMRIAQHERRHIREALGSPDCEFCVNDSDEWTKPTALRPDPEPPIARTGPHPNVGKKRTEAQKAHLREIALHRTPMSDETKAKISAASKGHSGSEKQRDAVRLTAHKRFHQVTPKSTCKFCISNGETL
jgi:hypothetical protein